jgi:hypothetical protein
MQEPQPLSRSLRYEKIDAGRVAAGVSEVAYKAKLDRVYTFAEDDWDRCRRSFHRERNKRGAYRGRLEGGSNILYSPNFKWRDFEAERASLGLNFAHLQHGLRKAGISNDCQPAELRENLT